MVSVRLIKANAIFFRHQGVTEIDQILTVLLKTSMAVGGIISLILDNLVPGTPEERGLIKWQGIQPTQNNETTKANVRVYDLPFGIGNNWKISKFLAFMPYYPAETMNVNQDLRLQEYRPTTDEGNKAI